MDTPSKVSGVRSFAFSLFWGIIIVISVSPSNAFAQKYECPLPATFARQDNLQPPSLQTQGSQSESWKEEVSFDYEFLTYWQTGFRVNNQGVVNTSYGDIPVRFFSSEYAPKSGAALSAGGLYLQSFGAIGFRLGGEWSSSKGRICWDSPDLGISYPEMESDFSIYDLWVGVLYAPFLLDKFPLRPHANIDVAWMNTSISVKLGGEEIESNKQGLHQNYAALRYGLGVDFGVDVPSIGKIGLVVKYQR